MPDEVSQNSNQIDPAIDLEKKKIELEIQKLQVEKYKARWSAMSAIVPILVAFVTIAYGAWSLNQTAKVQFGTKVVEVAMQNSRNQLDSIGQCCKREIASAMSGFCRLIRLRERGRIGVR